MTKNAEIIVDGQKYITIKKAAIYLELNCGRIRELLKNKRVKYHKAPSRIYILKKDIFEYKAKCDNIRDNYYPLLKASQLANMDTKYFYKIVKKYFKSYILFGGKYYVSKEEFENYIQKENDLNKNYYTLEESATLLDRHSSSVFALVKKKQFKGTLLFKNKYYIPKSEVELFITENFINNDEYIVITEANNLYGIDLRTLKKLPNTRMVKQPRFKALIYKKDIEAYLHRQKYLNTDPILEDSKAAYEFFIIESTNLFENSLYKETSTLYKNFVFLQLKKSEEKNKRKAIRRYIRCSRRLLKLIHKDIFLFDDNEIKLFLSEESITTNDSALICRFLLYCKSIKKNKCRFTVIPVIQRKYDNSEQRETIPEKTFVQYHQNVIDLNFHIQKAVKKSKHTQIWIYIMMHLFEAWRAGDIKSIPNIDLDQVNIVDFSYFNNNLNGLSKLQAEIILQQYYMHELIVNKTGACNSFNVPKSLIIPFATALTIAEIHRRKNNKKCIMYHFQNSYPKKSDYLRFFNGQSELAAFSNLKACRTFLTLFYEYVSEKSNLQSIANEVTRRLRSHKLQENDMLLTNTTSIYIQEMNNNEKEVNFSVHLFERGSFGWLYHTLLLFIAGDKTWNRLSLQDKTNLIVGIESKQSPLQIEGLGKFLLRQQEKKKILIDEIRNFPKEKLLDKIQGIYEGIMPARVPEAQCFVYGNCKHPKPQKICYQCEYLIPNKYFLVSLKNELFNLLKAFQDLINREEKAIKSGYFLSLDAEKMKLRWILLEYMNLLGEALDEECGLGRETVSAFIDLNLLYKSLEIVR
ncbi:hypothetical protein [Anaerosinus gibii]|uniref:Helix-turn-helix domain-containing protein n=1 Tax=Selenobaculum gibii TaxID=3054208 RepID=A0A9Y2AHV3_9FIRM|nr:hypothetical protein [Selenobaculum gbiensis]WIW70271.1 hypothetical protein P3F81_10280 [Selenobaculum gbiensis]